MLTASYVCVPPYQLRTFTAEEWEQSIPLDAPSVIPAGYWIRYKYANLEGFCPLPECVSREPA